MTNTMIMTNTTCEFIWQRKLYKRLLCIVLLLLCSTLARAADLIGNANSCQFDPPTGRIVCGNATVEQNSDFGIALGDKATVKQHRSIAIGAASQANGQHSISIGEYAGFQSNPEQSYSDMIYIGSHAGQYSASNLDIAIGKYAGQHAKGNGGNIAIGYLSGQNVGQNSTDGVNIAIGYEVGSDVIGRGNITLGDKSGHNVTGRYNMASGLWTGRNVTGDYNIAQGALAGEKVTGTGNLARGLYAGSAVTGTANTADGNYAGQSVVGDRNNAYGWKAGRWIQGNDNLSLGSFAGGNSAQDAAIAISETTSLGARSLTSVNTGVALGAHAKANRRALDSGSVITASNQITLSSSANTVYALPNSDPTYEQAIKNTVKGDLAAVSVGHANATRQITNVAAGSEDTDAVNVAQLRAAIGASGGGGDTIINNVYENKISVEAGKNIHVSEAKDGDVTKFIVATTANVAFNQVSVGPTIINQDGINAGGNKITHIADGAIAANSKDAINGGQLYQVINQFEDRINELDKDVRAGVASAVATTHIPQVYLPGKSAAGMGVGTYRGEHAIAIGISSISDNGKWIIKSSVGANRSGISAGAGVSYMW